jgi:bifunctional UDP-N-acetylglucosamine pyrophosphorylase / glucosamine-1-phosphate N-acetyltransferase
MTLPRFQAAILAAGKGTRMKSESAKVLFELMGRPLIGHVAQTALDAGAERVVAIVGHQKERVMAHLEETFGDRVEQATQAEQLGTGHALWSAHERLADGPDYTLVLSGDAPMLLPETIRAFIESTVASQALLGMMTSRLDDAASYGRIIRDGKRVVGVVEYRDATPVQREISEFNSGIYLARSAYLHQALGELMRSQPSNAQAEYYLTDLVGDAADRGSVHGWEVPAEEIQGINTRLDLAECHTTMRTRINRDMAIGGVSFLDIGSVHIEANVSIGADSLLHPNVMLLGQTTIGRGVTIEQGVTVRNCQIESGAHIKAHCHLTNARIGQEAQIGPFAHLRPGADIGENCKVGNFVEIKKTRMNRGSKASHLTYLGDAEIGQGANIGAGTITCNYDGTNKSRTDIGEGAFIGSNTALVAPVTIGAGAYVGAGSVITQDVPARSLGVARGRQKNIDGWADR